MKIENIENNIHKISNPNHISVIELIVDAVKTYPLYELNDTEEYFSEIMKLLKSDNINIENLKNYMQKCENLDEENIIWINSSLNSLMEAFELMQLHKIPFNEVKKIITALE